MIGIVFLISLLLFFTAVLCQWALSSRSKGESWLFNWFPPYSVFYAAQHRKAHKLPFLTLIFSLLATFIAGGAWFVFHASTTSIPQSSVEAPKWKVTKKGNIVYISKADELVSSEEWVIEHKDLALPFTEEVKVLEHPSVKRVYQDTSSKEFVVSELPTNSVSFSKQGMLLDISLEFENESITLVADANGSMQQQHSVTSVDVEQALKIVSPRLPQHMSFKVGPIRSISEKQSIAGIQILHKQKLLKELTVTLDIRNNETVLNHRSMMVLRNYISDYRDKNRETKHVSQIQLDSFFAQASNYHQKPVTVVKLDKTEQKGLFLTLDKKVLNIRQPLGSGMIDVQIPLNLIQTLKFSNFEIEVQPAKPAEIPRAALPEENGTVADVAENESQLGQTTAAQVSPNKMEPTSQADLTQKTEQEKPASKVSDDPYLKLVNKDIVLTKKDGQKRVGKLVKVIPKKSLTIQLLNGGLEIQIPQSEVEIIELAKKK